MHDIRGKNHKVTDFCLVLTVLHDMMPSPGFQKIKFIMGVVVGFCHIVIDTLHPLASDGCTLFN